MSPTGGRAALMASAPRCARTIVANGPDRFMVRSTIRTPAKGPLAAPVIAAPYSARTLRGRPETGPRPGRNAVASTDDAAVDELLDTLERWLASEVVPNVLELEHADEYPRAMVEQMREFGLFAATIPEEYGGLGLGASAYVRIVEAVARAWMSLTGVVNTHLMVAELVRRYGTDEQRVSFLPQLAAAELRGGLALTEPDCGTDLQAVRTTATRADGVYVLRGTKMWITNAQEGNCLAVLAKTDVGAEPRHRGMSLFIVPKDLGYTVTRRLGKLGYKGIDTCEVVFDDVVVPEECLLGGVEGRGFHQAVGALELGRINIAARGVGVADAALRASVAYAQQRHTMGKPIAQHQ